MTAAATESQIGNSCFQSRVSYCYHRALVGAKIAYLYEVLLQDIRVLGLAGIQLLVEVLVGEDRVGSVADNRDLRKVGSQGNLGGFGVQLEVDLFLVSINSPTLVFSGCIADY